MPPLTSTRRRIVAAALSIPLILAAAPLGAQARSMYESRRPVAHRVCHFDWRAGPRQVKKLIKCAAVRWDSPGGRRKALSVARCESGYKPDAYNSGGYAGVYQHAVTYWPGRADRWGFPDRSVFNGRANIIVSIRMARAVGWGAWSCA